MNNIMKAFSALTRIKAHKRLIFLTSLVEATTTLDFYQTRTRYGWIQVTY